MKLDWLLYAAVITGIVVGVGTWRDQSNAPLAPPPPGVGEMALFANFTPFAASSIINLPVDDQKVMTGTAFSVSQSGEWVVARNSVGTCKHPFLNIGGNLGVPFKVREVKGADNYFIAQTEGGGRPLPLADPASIKPGIRGFMPGFPGGEAGEATARLIGTTVLEHSKRGQGNETVLAWALAGHTDGLKTDLNKLVGGPVIDDNSRVIGIVIREDPRRGRIYTSVPATLTALTGSARQPDFENEATVTKRNYGIVADTLRREYRIAQVGCVKS
jgi:hypothetical protein